MVKGTFVHGQIPEKQDITTFLAFCVHRKYIEVRSINELYYCSSRLAAGNDVYKKLNMYTIKSNVHARGSGV